MGIRTFLVTLLVGASFAVSAQEYPTRPVTMIVTTPAGGASDSLARALAEELKKRMGQTFVVENKGGAAGAIGLQALARSAPDGYTLSMTATTPLVYGPYTMPRLPFDPKKDFSYVSVLAGVQFVLAVHKDVPVRNMKEFVAWARQNKGKVNYGSYGAGGAGHLISAYLNESLKLDMRHAAYKGEVPLVQDLVGGQVAWGIGTKGALAPFIASGKLRALAVVGDHRFADMPDLPTMAEAGFPEKEYIPVGWYAVLAPAGVPAPILTRLEKAIGEAARSTRMKALYQVYGMELIGEGSAQLRKSIEASAPVIENLVKVSGYKPE